MSRPWRGLLRRAGARLQAGLLAGVLAVPAPLWAQGLAPQTSQEAIAEAKRLYRRGKARFDTADYLQAIELFTEAYAVLPETETTEEIRAALLRNIASSRMQAYRIDDDIRHLKQARQLLSRYVETMTHLKGGTWKETAEAKDLRRWIDMLDRELATANERGAQGPAAETATDSEDSDDQPASTEPSSLDATSSDPTTSSKPSDADRNGTRASDQTEKSLITGGSIALALGLGASATGIAGAVLGKQAEQEYESAPPDEHPSIDRRGRIMNALAISGFVASAALLAGGAIMLGLGLQRRAQRLSIAPVAGPGFAGLKIGTSF